jgi:hypothetical protein
MTVKNPMKAKKKQNKLLMPAEMVNMRIMIAMMIITEEAVEEEEVEIEVAVDLEAKNGNPVHPAIKDKAKKAHHSNFSLVVCHMMSQANI